MSCSARSLFEVFRVATVVGLLLAGAVSGACNDDGPCVSEGAVRVSGVCKCPQGWRYVQDRAAKIDRCESDVSDAAITADAAVAPPRTGLDATVVADGGRDAEVLKPDRDVAAPSTADAQVPSASDAQVADPPAAEASVQGGNAPPADVCPTSGALRCVAPGTAARQRCDAGQWTTAESCAASEICDSASAGSVTCRPVVEACKGSADKPACDGATMLFCGKTGFADRTTPCDSKLQCEVGLARGACAPCLPGAARCTGATLEKCSADGQKYEAVVPACSSAALCNAQAGACTASACVAGSKTCKGDILQTCNATLTGFDEQMCGAGLCDGVGRQCDVCVPNTRSCADNSVQSCNAQGQGFDTVACDSAKPFCTGKGNCVQCRQPVDCASPGECSIATCNAASGSCGSMFKPSGTVCSVGICDGKGACGPAPVCGDGVKNQPSEECDDGNRVDQDDCLTNCKAASCGDGVVNMFGTNAQKKEECDSTAIGVNVWKCTAACKRTTFYGNCEKDSSCSSGEMCLGTCTKLCDKSGVFGAGSGCPPAVAPTRELCEPGLTPLCRITGCNTGADCPEGQVCFKYDDPAPNQIYTSVCLNRN